MTCRSQRKILNIVNNQNCVVHEATNGTEIGPSADFGAFHHCRKFLQYQFD